MILTPKTQLAAINKNPWIAVSLATLLLYIGLALLAHWGLLVPDFNLTNNSNAYSPPSLRYPFGTDFLGRNVLSRAIHGIRISLMIGLFASGIATSLGLFLGLVSGYFGKKVDDLVVWLYTTMDSIPTILLILAFVYSMGQGLSSLFIVLGLTSWVKLCRLVRGEVIKQKQQDYVISAQAFGLPHLQIIFRHILPNVAHLALIQFNLIFVFAIKVEVILSFLGVGVEPGTPSWGTMINDARVELTRGIWWQLMAATSFMFFLILAVNILTDSLQQKLNPKSS